MTRVSTSTYLPPNSSLPDVMNAASYCFYPFEDQPALRRGHDRVAADPSPSAAGTPAACNIVFCDGSVRFIKNTVNLFVWRGLGTTQGGEVLGADAY